MRKILTILLLACSLVAEADKWYIATAANGGSDTGGDGSLAHPWLTLKHAADTVTGASFVGDTIVVGVGTFTETAQIVKGLGVHIYGAGVTSIIVSTYAAAYTGSINCATAEGNPVNDGGSISYITLSGSNYTARIGIYVAYRNNVDIHHCTISGFNYGAIKYKTNNADVFTAPTVTYATGHSIHDNNINDCGYLNSSYASVWFDGTDGMEVYNNTFVDTARAPGSNSWATIKCTFNKGYAIHDNTFYREDHEDDRFNFFIENWNYGGGCQIYDNTFRGLANVDIGGMDNSVGVGYAYGMKVYNNRMINGTNGIYTKPGGTSTIIGITIEGDKHEKVYVYNNLIQRYGLGIEISTPTASTGGYEYDWDISDIYIYNNIIENVGYSDSQYCYGLLYINETNLNGYTVTTDNINILNNTITAISGSTYQGIRFSGGDMLSNLNIKNNIIKGFDSYGIYLGEHATDGLSMTNVAVTYNCMNGNGTNTVGIDGDIVQTNFDVATGNITGDPLFKSSTDFHLQSTSPCRDAGIDVSAITGGTDFHGASLYGAAYDIGAFEYGAGRMILIGTTIPTINYKIPLIDH